MVFAITWLHTQQHNSIAHKYARARKINWWCVFLLLVSNKSPDGGCFSLRFWFASFLAVYWTSFAPKCDEQHEFYALTPIWFRRLHKKKNTTKLSWLCKLFALLLSIDMHRSVILDTFRPISIQIKKNTQQLFPHDESLLFNFWKP